MASCGRRPWEGGKRPLQRREMELPSGGTLGKWIGWTCSRRKRKRGAAATAVDRGNLRPLTSQPSTPLRPPHPICFAPAYTLIEQCIIFHEMAATLPPPPSFDSSPCVEAAELETFSQERGIISLFAYPPAQSFLIAVDDHTRTHPFKIAANDLGRC